MQVKWDAGDELSRKFSGPFSEVTVGPRQVAVFLDNGQEIGTLSVGVHTPASVPFLANLSAAAELHFVDKAPRSERFGSAGVQLPPGGPVTGELRHFGSWRYQVFSPGTFARAASGGDPIEAAGRRIGDLFDACALEWIKGGHMGAADLAANQEKFRQVLPAHIGPAVEAWGLSLVDLEDFHAEVQPL